MATLTSYGKQHGLALLILLIMLVLGGVFLAVTAMNKSSAALALARDQKTQAALDRAKQALLAYVATVAAESEMNSISHSPNRGVPGYLPCPDKGTSFAEGDEAGTCDPALVSTIGKLPWHSLGLEPLRDGDGECLWYAVSGTYKDNPNGVRISNISNMMNWDTPGLFDMLAADGTTYLTGGSPSARAVAVIFAPGAVLAGQNRSSSGGTPNCGGNYTAANYLETANSINNSAVSTVASAITQFIAGRASDTFNDRLVYITRDELWTAIKKRPDFQARLNALTRKVAECIAQYGTQNSAGMGDKRLPWGTNVSLSSYAIDAIYNDSLSDMSGRVSYRVNTSRSDTSNSISLSPSGYPPPSVDASPYYLFTTSSYCHLTGTLDDRDINWYSNWKDHLFYAVADRFKPSAVPPTPACTGATCLKVNGGSIYYAAVVMFAGERLAGQVRDTDADRANIANYLEGNNTSSNSSGNNSYQTGAATTTFNDILYCIGENLSVTPCP
ncbi:MAG: hypothetical protein WBM28_17850 [Burkholderiales bacterium]